MSKIYFASDHHFGHKNILTFKSMTGQPLRSFRDIRDHDLTILHNHNSMVNDDDLVYFLGDLVWKTNKDSLSLISSLKGRKRICVGNHDNADWLFRTQLFERVYLWKYFPEHNMIASHVPLSDNDMKRVNLNVHGHTHEKTYDGKYLNKRYTAYKSDTVMNKVYYNASMEAINYSPVPLDYVLNRAVFV